MTPASANHLATLTTNAAAPDAVVTIFDVKADTTATSTRAQVPAGGTQRNLSSGNLYQLQRILTLMDNASASLHRGAAARWPDDADDRRRCGCWWLHLRRRRTSCWRYEPLVR